MTVTVTLSENIAERLEAHAAEFHLSLDAFLLSCVSNLLTSYAILSDHIV